MVADQGHMISFKKKLNNLHSKHSDSERIIISTIDAHTGGEPLRIITAGLAPIPGNTMLKKREHMKNNLDHFRKTLMWEPRGHADMYGCIITEPVSPESDFGVLFMHNEGYSTMCGHGIIAVTKVALECGLIPIKGEISNVRIDSPAGLIAAKAFINKGDVESVSFANVPSFVQALDQYAEVKGIGRIKYDIAFGGAFYAFVNAYDAKVSLTPENHSDLIQKGMAIKQALMESLTFHHPHQEDLNFLYGTIFIGDPLNKNTDSRNVCVFAEGEVDRSPTGTGVSGRLAIHYARGELRIGEPMVIESILGSSFKCKINDVIKFGSFNAVIPEVEGTAFITGEHTFIIDPKDPLKGGFIFR